MDWFTDLPVWLRYVAALGVLGAAAGLQLMTNTINVWVYGVGFALLLAAMLFRD
jgi:hypothetical protein